MVLSEYGIIRLVSRYLASARYYHKSPKPPIGSRGTESSDFDDIRPIIDGEQDDTRLSSGVNESDVKESLRDERQRIKRSIIRKKSIIGSKTGKIFTILTQRAKEQMFFLQQEEDYSVEELVEKFPVTLDSCRQLIERPLKSLTIEELIRDNEVIINRLQMVRALSRSGRLDRYTEFLWLTEGDVISLVQHANGNDSLPYPGQSMLEIRDQLEAARVPGPMESVLALVTVNNNSSVRSADQTHNILEKQKAILYKVLSHFKSDAEKYNEWKQLQSTRERPTLTLPNKARLDYSSMFRHKTDSQS